MQDFYEALGVSRTASQTQIKAAFKRMAMRYHPDRNPGNKQAEETFKFLNEAYQTLSDPVKRSRYDSRFHIITEELNDAYWQEINPNVSTPRMLAARDADEAHPLRTEEEATEVINHLRQLEQEASERGRT